VPVSRMSLHRGREARAPPTCRSASACWRDSVASRSCCVASRQLFLSFSTSRDILETLDLTTCSAAAKGAWSGIHERLPMQRSSASPRSVQHPARASGPGASPPGHRRRLRWRWPPTAVQPAPGSLPAAAPAAAAAAAPACQPPAAAPPGAARRAAAAAAPAAPQPGRRTAPPPAGPWHAPPWRPARTAASPAACAAALASAQYNRQQHGSRCRVQQRQQAGPSGCRRRGERSARLGAQCTAQRAPSPAPSPAQRSPAPRTCTLNHPALIMSNMLTAKETS
jgi:hypothetical protein